MKFLLNFFTILTCMGAVSFAQDADMTAKQVADHIQRRYEMIDDAVAQFEQHVKFGFSSIEQTFVGTLTMKKPNRYRIESEHQTIVTDGITVWAYSETNHQVIIDKYKENQNSISPEVFMLNLPSNYYGALIGEESFKSLKCIVLKLTPKDDRSFIKSVKIWVDEQNWMVHKIFIVDVNETETTYVVKDIKLNSNIREKVFIFSVPDGADVVDLR
jgi:outer membrane lipoprotein carrier protein